MSAAPLLKTILFGITLCCMLGGCGYTFQNSRNPLEEKEGVRKIYVAPMVNGTFKPGVENVVFNALVKTLSAHRRVVLVSSAHDADAVLGGSIMQAASSPTQAKAASDLNTSFPLSRWGSSVVIPADYSTYNVAWEYQASLTCQFELKRAGARPGKAPVIWAAGFSRSKPYPGSNQLGPPGTTSALINESEFERALTDLADSMMEDVHESMLAMF